MTKFNIEVAPLFGRMEQYANDGVNPDDAYTWGVTCDTDLSEEEAEEQELFRQMRAAAIEAGLESSTWDVRAYTDAYGDQVYGILDCWKADEVEARVTQSEIEEFKL